MASRLQPWLLCVCALLLGGAPVHLHAAPPSTIAFNVPAQSADRALLEFSKQARIDILFSYEQLRQVRSRPVVGRYEPQQALELLLQGTGFVPQRSGEAKWVVTPGPPAGKIKGKVVAPDGSPARRVRVIVSPGGQSTFTTESGDFEFGDLPGGHYEIYVPAPNYRPLQIVAVAVREGQTTLLGTHTLQRIEDPTRLEPFVVQADSTRARSLDHSEAHFGARSAGGNLDLSRTESDVLPYMIFNRAQITRSGVVNLNEFLQRELIDSSAGALPPEQDASPRTAAYSVGSTNLGLRGYGSDETVILVNGRRLPEVVTSMGDRTLPPDVNLIPLSLVQQVEVLPVSASSLYSGNAVGGVINIVLRPDVDTNISEVTTTYTNAMAHFDAPQTSLSLLHARSLLGGALRVRLNAAFDHSLPATEGELGFRQRQDRIDPNPDIPVFRATPNIRSVRPTLLRRGEDFSDDGAATEPPSMFKSEPAPPPLPPLAGAGSSPVVSVAPGADGRGGLTAFTGRPARPNRTFFDPAGPFSSSIDSQDFPYGREQQRNTFYGSVVYDATRWLQFAMDAMYSNTRAHRGLEVMAGDLTLPATSAFNPFGQDVRVSLNETAPKLGPRYSEAKFDLGSMVFGAMIRLPADWRLSLDSQYSRNVVRYRGLVGADSARWQQLVTAGGYNPLRDTQAFGPPEAFYDQVLVYRGHRGRFVTLGDYDVIDLAARATNEKLRLPTGTSVINVGGDYRRNHLAAFTDERRYADGTLATDPEHWGDRTLARYSFFGEAQSPILPKPWLPKWISDATSDVALRYVASSSTKEANWAPTYGLKLVLPVGLTLRGSITTSSRFPTPTMSRQVFTPVVGEGTGSVERELIHDYVRKEQYTAVVMKVENPNLRPVDAVTQTAGLVFQRGKTHRFRAAIDFVDTHKINEDVTLEKDQVTANEALWPERVLRASPNRVDGTAPGRIQAVYTGRVNLSSRFSQDWTTSVDYRWNQCLGGTLEAYARVLYFHRYIVRAQPNSPRVDELNEPDGVMPILKYRANLGASWSNRLLGGGVDAHYFHSRLLPRAEWEAQGHDRIRPFWQIDAFTQTDLSPWLPGNSGRYGLRAQARVNNLFGSPFPKYVNDPYGAGVQPYGDWRGRVYSVSVTVTF